MPSDDALLWQFGCVECKEGFADGHVDVDRLSAIHPGGQQGFVHQAVAMPSRLVIVGFGQRDTFAHQAPKGMRLLQRLSVELFNPCRRTVCRNHHQWRVAVVCFCHGRCKIEQGCARGDTHHHHGACGLCHAKGIETCAALIGHWMAGDVAAGVEVVHNGHVS